MTVTKENYHKEKSKFLLALQNKTTAMEKAGDDGKVPHSKALEKFLRDSKETIKGLVQHNLNNYGAEKDVDDKVDELMSTQKVDQHTLLKIAQNIEHLPEQTIKELSSLRSEKGVAHVEGISFENLLSKIAQYSDTQVNTNNKSMTSARNKLQEAGKLESVSQKPGVMDAATLFRKPGQGHRIDAKDTGSGLRLKTKGKRIQAR